jgi:MoxR-like ATPase
MLKRRVDISTEHKGRQDLPDAQEIDDIEVSFQKPAGRKRRIEIRREPYRPSAELIAAVNVAIALGRPLLLQGEPGCGKTRLAHALAYELGLPLEEGYIKSTSRAQDFLYTYDALNRLYDAQLLAREGDAGGSADRRTDVRRYLEFGPLGRAIAKAQGGQRSVVLIDEIDKADLDFPNDLLLELDRLRFQVELDPDLKFAAPEGSTDLRPIVIVTHNEEKALPTAFLRRCVYHYVKFPEGQAALHEILALHGLDEDTAYSDRAIDALLKLRAIDLAKKPGLSELIDWVGYMRAVKTPVEELDKLEKLPYLGVLLKQRGDQSRVLGETAV